MYPIAHPGHSCSSNVPKMLKRFSTVSPKPKPKVKFFQDLSRAPLAVNTQAADVQKDASYAVRILWNDPNSMVGHMHNDMYKY